MKRNRRLATTCSVLLWGAGQFFICKQRIKGLILFLLQMIVIGVELFTGYWPEVIAGQITDVSVRVHGGFFSRGLWGLFSLGKVEGGRNADHSTMLMITGIIVILLLLVILGVYIFNLRDAYSTGKLMDET